MIALLFALACAPRMPPPPPLSTPTAVVDRSDLPSLSLYALHTAAVTLPHRHAVAGGTSADGGRAPVTAWLIDHPEHGRVLVDAGFGRRTAVDPTDLPGKLSQRLLTLEMGVPAADQLIAHGDDPSHIHTVIITHVHHDHVAGVEDFPAAFIWMDAEDLRWGAKRGRLHGVDARPIAGRTIGAPDWAAAGPYAVFPHHMDLFGDNTVVLLPSPGHTPGSLSVLVNLPTASVLFVGDAAWIDANWERPAPKGWLVRGFLEHDWRKGADALWRIRALQAAWPELIVVSGHDPRTWQRVPSYPEAWVPAPDKARQ